MPVLSVVMPAHNEELTIAEAVDDILKHVVKHVTDVEVIVVDDGSTDRTASILQRLESDAVCLRVITQKNAGHGAALRTGIDAASGDWIMVLDSDCQIGLEGFPKHWETCQGSDALLGIRTPRSDPPHRLVISKLMRSAIWIFTGCVPADAGAPYKIFKRSVWRDASRFIDKASWIPSVLFAVFVLKTKPVSVLEIPVPHRIRQQGQSTLNAKRLMKFCFYATREIRRFGRAMDAASAAQK